MRTQKIKFANVGLNHLMKKTLRQLISMVIFMLVGFAAQARVWTVDNSPGAGPDHTNLQTCHNAAASGDTIILMPSYNSYGAITVSKKIYLYSRGHSSNTLDKDKRATVSSFNLTTGSDNSVIKGLYIISSININTSNNSIINNFISGNLSIQSNSNLIQGNVILGYNIIQFGANAQQNLVLNNYMVFTTGGGFYSNSNYLVYGGNSSNLLVNNFIAELQYGGGAVSGGGLQFFTQSYVKIYNNILWSNMPGRTTFQFGNFGSVFKNNLTYSSETSPAPLPGFNYNDTMPLFEGGYDRSNLPFYRTDNDFRLKSTSVGKNGGTDSTDVGLYGQNFPFSIEGNVPGVAIFDDFEVLNPVIKKGGTLKVRVSARKPE